MQLFIQLVLGSAPRAENSAKQVNMIVTIIFIVRPVSALLIN
jgi:hypothetical protein